MSKYKAVIIDDEHNCVQVLEILLQRDYSDIEVVKTFTASKEALVYLQSNEVDIVFLDIQMPFLTGIDILNRLEKYNFHVIFTTAFDQYAVNAIKLSALDYLLKPIDEDLLEQSILKFRNVKNKSDIQTQITTFLQQYNNNTTNPNAKIAVTFHDKILFYEPQQIFYCQSNDNYTTIILKTGEKIVASKTIKHFEELLIPHGFIRPHQSYLINTKYIGQYNKKDGGAIVMDDNTNIPVSRHRKEEILRYFKNEKE